MSRKQKKVLINIKVKGKLTLNYGSTGCGVFNKGIKNEIGLWLKINVRTPWKLLNFDNLCKLKTSNFISLS